MNMDVVKNQLSIPSYEKPAMEVMSLELEEGVLTGSQTYEFNMNNSVSDNSGNGTDFGGNDTGTSDFWN
ncbi:MAG: hypothetical protein MJZ33_09000 [Paludibacteraceae bacterium]|nr:hypothetical protein [Paludibacteraceae bacterium]